MLSGCSLTPGSVMESVAKQSGRVTEQDAQYHSLASTPTHGYTHTCAYNTHTTHVHCTQLHCQEKSSNIR